MIRNVCYVCLFTVCIPVLILIKLQISLYILLENFKLHCNLHEKLAWDLFVPWEHDSLGMKLSFFIP